MEYKFKLLLSEKERDLIIDLIEHRIFLIRARIDEHKKPVDCKELNMLEKIGDRLT